MNDASSRTVMVQCSKRHHTGPKAKWAQENRICSECGAWIYGPPGTVERALADSTIDAYIQLGMAYAHEDENSMRDTRRQIQLAHKQLHKALGMVIDD